MLSAEDKREISHQTNAMIGQLRAIQKMLRDERDAQAIYIQFKAVEGLLDKALYTILDDLFRKKLASTIVKVLDECYSEDCPHCSNIELVKKEFTRMNIAEVLKNLSKLDHCTIDEP